MDGVLNYFCHVTFIIAFYGSPLVVTVVKTVRTKGNDLLLLVLHLVAIYIVNLIS